MGEADELAWETLASETDCIWPRHRCSSGE
jgi:hypothetical protein